MHGAVLAFCVSVCASVEGFLEVGGSAKQLYAWGTVESCWHAAVLEAKSIVWLSPPEYGSVNRPSAAQEMACHIRLS